MGLFPSRNNPDFEITDFSIERHDEYYQKGFACIDPYVQLQGRLRKRTNKNKESIFSSFKSHPTPPN
jgi:hypothetical protein